MWKNKGFRFIVFFIIMTLLLAFGDIPLKALSASTVSTVVLFLCVLAGTALLPLAETRTSLAVYYFIGMGLLVAGHVTHSQTLNILSTKQLICRLLGTLLMLGSLLFHFRIEKNCKQQKSKATQNLSC